MGLQLLEESEKRALVGGLIAAEVSEQAFVLFRPVIGVRSRGLSGPALPSLTREPAPSLINRERMIERLKLYANAYVRTLPDFLCNEITDRYSNLRGVAASGSARYNKHMHHSDTLTAELAFAPRMQRDRLRLASNTESLRNKQGQSLSMGEFGQDMATILGPHADPELKWECWRRRGDREAAVFVYFVPQPRSGYKLFFWVFGSRVWAMSSSCTKPPFRVQSMLIQRQVKLISSSFKR